MAPFNPPRGLIAELITPLARGGAIDDQGLKQLLARVLPHVHAVFLAGPHAGEGRNLQGARRAEILDKASSVIQGRVPVLVWITQDTEEGTLETLLLLRSSIEKRKYRGRVFWVDSPLYYRSNRGLSLYYEKISSMAAGPLLLHNDPELIRGTGQALKRTNIRTSILKGLAALEPIRGLIFSGTLTRAQNYHRAVRQRKDFRIYDGDETAFLTHPSLSGVVSLGANLAPRAWLRVTDSSLHLNGNEGDYPDHVRQIWETGEYLRNLMEAYRAYPVPLIKQVLFELGVIESPKCISGEKTDLKDIASIREWMKRSGDLDR